MTDFESRPQLERDLHIGKIMWVCNVALERNFFKSKYVDIIDKYMNSKKSVNLEDLLKDTDYSKIKNSMKNL